MSPKVVDGRIERIVDCASLIRAMPVALSQTGGEEAMTPPETRYAKSGDVRIAYQTVGNGPLDLVFVLVSPPTSMPLGNFRPGRGSFPGLPRFLA